MRSSIAVACAFSGIVAVSILAVPAVASGADYLASKNQEASTTAIYAPVANRPARASDANTAGRSRPASDLTGLITAWGAGGVVLLGGGAIAVAASVRRQRNLAT